MEGVRVKLELRIGAAAGKAAEDCLDVVKRRRAGARDIGEERTPRAVVGDRAQFGDRAEQFWADRHPPGDRVPLLLVAALIFIGQKRLLHARESLGGKEVAHFDEPFAIELLAPLCWDSGRKAAAARPGHAMSKLQPGNMKPEPIEPLRPENRIVSKALRAGGQRQQPDGSAPPAEERTPVDCSAFLPRERRGHFLDGFVAVAQEHDASVSRNLRRGNIIFVQHSS